MCGICGVANLKRQPSVTVTNLRSKLRHRGYDSWGTVLYDPKDATGFTIHRSSGPVVKELTMANFQLGHTRYTTQGDHTSLDEAQPLISKSGRIALVHNGQIETPKGTKGSDSVYLLSVLEEEFASVTNYNTDRETHHLISQALHCVHNRVKGSYACIMIVQYIGMIAFRDPLGIRPLSVNMQNDVVEFASESCAFDRNDRNVRDIPSGQFCWITLGGVLRFRWTHLRPSPKLCLFEFIYLAHNESVIEGIKVRDARKKLGQLLVPKIQESGFNIDVIIPIPDTPVLAAHQIALETGIKCVEVLRVPTKTTNNETRTFILPTQDARANAVKKKFEINSALIDECRGKSVLLLDDSIVRGTTLKHVVSLIRERIQPSKIYLASLAPPIINTNRYGIDIPTTDELVADRGLTHRQNAELVAQKLGADGPVIYQTLQVIEDGFKRKFEDSVFVAAVAPVAPPKRTIREILGDQF
jgi:amidophosphoribosyltransferase